MSRLENHAMLCDAATDVFVWNFPHFVNAREIYFFIY